MTNTCKHASTTESRPYGFRASVAHHPFTRENRAAHGGICVLVTCDDCGAQREENSNGRHEEIGTWGRPRTERLRPVVERYNAARGAAPKSDNPTQLHHPDGRVLLISVDRDGEIVIRGNHSSAELSQIGAAIPAHIVSAATTMREAYSALLREGATGLL